MISYLQIEEVSKRYGELTLFENISFGINKDQKIALIAKNGAGKTSLLNIVAGIEAPDQGQVTSRNDISTGYLEQDPDFLPQHTVIEQVFYTSNQIVQAVRNYETALTTNDKDLLQQATEAMDRLQAWDYEVRIKQILSKLSINNFDQLVGTLSGGQRKRLALANILINQPDLIILDEPTNHLDLSMIEWLEDYLKNTNSTLLMVTHDRYFLDRVCNEIIELDNNTIHHYRGNYAYFLEKRHQRIRIETSSIQKARSLLRKELDWIRRSPSARGTKAKSRIDAFHELKGVAEQQTGEQQIAIDILSRRLGKKILELYYINKAFDDKTLIKDFTYKFAPGDKIGIVGPNGCGKSTFLNLITGQLKLDSGTYEVGETVYFGYYKQDGLQFDSNKRVIEVIKEVAEVVELSGGRKTSAKEFLEYFLFPPESHYNRVAKLSGGERRRLYLMTVLMQQPNFLILDEPTNDLDILTLNVLEEYLQEFQGCLLIVSHDRYFMDKVVDTLFVFEGQGHIRHFPGNYTQYYYQRLAEEKNRKSLKKQAPEDKPAKQQDKQKAHRKFSYKEKRELELVEKELDALSQEKESLEITVNSGELSPEELSEQATRLAEILELLDEKEMRWLELTELQDEA